MDILGFCLETGGLDLVVRVPVEVGSIKLIVLARVLSYSDGYDQSVHVSYEDYDSITYMGTEVESFSKLAKFHSETLGINLCNVIDKAAEDIFGRKEALEVIKSYLTVLITSKYE
jgi:hypothetical protein